MDGPGSHQFWHIQHQVRCLVLWDPLDRNNHLWKDTISRYKKLKMIKERFFLSAKSQHYKWHYVINSYHPYFYFFRDDKSRGDSMPGQVVQDAVSRWLSKWTLWYHDDVLEGEAWWPANIWFSAKHTQRFLYRHRGTIWDAPVIEENVSCCLPEARKRLEEGLEWIEDQLNIFMTHTIIFLNKRNGHIFLSQFYKWM